RGHDGLRSQAARAPGARGRRRRERAMIAAAAALLALAQAAAGPAGGEALLDAAKRGDAVAVRDLLDRGVSANTANKHGTTALILASSKGSLDVVRLLVEKGADVNARDRFFGFTPVAAAAQDHLDVVLYLVEKGADAVDEALFPAIRANDARLVRAVLETSKVEPLDLEAARRTDTEKQSPEIKELLARATAAPRRTAPYSIPGERLEAYA